MRFAAAPDSLAGADQTLVVATCDERWLCALTPQERREYDELPHAARRRDWLAGRRAAKRAIRARYDVRADEIELTPVPGAAPRPSIRRGTGEWAPLSLRLTIAHRDGVALAAVFSSTVLVGVDVERAGALSPAELRYFLSEDERARLGDLDATLVWVLKEAAWKALGLGAAMPLSSLQLVFRGDAPDLVAVRHGSRELRARAALARLHATRPLIAALVEIAPEAS